MHLNLRVLASRLGRAEATRFLSFENVWLFFVGEWRSSKQLLYNQHGLMTLLETGSSGSMAPAAIILAQTYCRLQWITVQKSIGVSLFLSILLVLILGSFQRLCWQVQWFCIFLFFLMKVNIVSMTKIPILCSFLREVSGEVRDILLPHLLGGEKKRSLEPPLLLRLFEYPVSILSSSFT